MFELASTFAQPIPMPVASPSDGSENLLYVLLLRAFALLCGVVITWLGYKLLRAGIFDENSEIKGKWAGKGSLVIKKAAPGTVFCIFAIILMMGAVLKPIEVGGAYSYVPEPVQKAIVSAFKSDDFSDEDKRLLFAWLMANGGGHLIAKNFDEIEDVWRKS